MTKGYKKFDYFLNILEEKLAIATKEKNPALSLYSNNARTPLFMLEALSKLFEGIHNKKKFGKLKDRFKSLEDGIGAIDYYDNITKELQTDARIPDNVKDYLLGQTREKIQRLNDILTEDNWIGDHAVRIKKIREKLKEAEWLQPKKEAAGIAAFYHTSIKEINVFLAQAEEGYTEMETQVHELRRELRWLSIYPQALQGQVQLSENNIVDPVTDKYITPEISGSPFNKMPEKGDNSPVVLLEKKYFLSLSWIISALGNQKDEGLRILAVAEALQQIENLSHTNALIKAIGIFDPEHMVMDNLLKETSRICKTFSEDQILNKLLTGIAE